MKINTEKQEIIDTKGNILVTANPGTGKTLLLAHKYLSLINEGVKPEDILCLTFTEKAKREMEERIVRLKTDQKINLDISKLNVHTFHSYSLNSLDNKEIISPNLLRFSIYLYIKENKILNYTDRHIIDILVPKIENLIRYLKSFGILPNKISFSKAKRFLPQNSKLSRNELEKFLDEFIKTYSRYEQIKESNGFDYADLLIEFINLKNPPSYKYVLVDELQDVNSMEAEIALRSAENFIAVGDKKQAIFGFQGGSIINFELFKNCSHFVLSENFRSTNQILNYAKNYFISKTIEHSHKEELKDLNNALGLSGDKPGIIEVDKNSLTQSVIKLLGIISGQEKTTAVILRTNNQIADIGKELESYGIEFSTTFFSGSEDAKNDIITFLKAVLSKDIQEIKNSMFTPFFPISIQDAFEFSEKEYKNLNELLNDCIEFKKLRKSIKTKFDLIKLFKQRITPISLSYGKHYYMAAEKINGAFFESLSLLESKKLSHIFDYLQSFDLATDEIEDEKNIVLTTIHKAKGKEFDNVIYIPASTRNQTNFVDDVVEAILKSKGINAEEELEEESLRINFVAFTRAKERLYIITEKSAEYGNEFAENMSLGEIQQKTKPEPDSYKKDAYSLFVNKEYDKAKSLLEKNNIWLIDFINNYFKNLKSLSFTSVKPQPFEYLVDNILRIKEFSPALKLGNEIHLAAEKHLKGEDYDINDPDYVPYLKNMKLVTNEVKSAYPDLYKIEEFFDIPLSYISDLDGNIKFRGKIDAVFKNGSSYLILDWKTNRTTEKASEHRQQLASYKRSFCKHHNVPAENVEVAIAYLGLRSSVDTGEVNWELDLKQPAKTAFNTFTKKLKKILEWKNDPEQFLEELSEEKVKSNERLWKSIVDQYLFEKKKI